MYNSIPSYNLTQPTWSSSFNNQSLSLKVEWKIADPKENTNITPNQVPATIYPGSPRLYVPPSDFSPNTLNYKHNDSGYGSPLTHSSTPAARLCSPMRHDVYGCPPNPPVISQSPPKTPSPPFKTTSNLESPSSDPFVSSNLNHKLHPPKPPSSDTILYPPTSSSPNISSPKHDAIDVHNTLDGPANQPTNVTDVHDTLSDPTDILPLQHDAIDAYPLDDPANQPINVVHVKQPLAPDLQHVAIDNTIDGPANQPVNATDVHDTPSGPTKQSPPQHDAIDVHDTPNGPNKVHHTPNGLAPLSSNDTSTLPKDPLMSSISSSNSKSVPDSILSKSASKSPSTCGQKPRNKSFKKPKYITSPKSEDGDIILVRDPQVDPMNCKYVPKPRKLTRSGKKKIFLGQNLDAGRMDILGSCRFCGEKLASCYSDLHILTCTSFDDTDVTLFYKKMANLTFNNDPSKIKSVAIDYCLYLLHISEYDINELLDLKSLNTFFAELELFLDTRAAKMFKKLGYTNSRRFNILKYP